MPKLIVRYELTDEEVLKLCSNVYTRTGSALKNNLDGSKIFKHLKEIGWDIENDKTAKNIEVPANNFSWLLNFIKTPVGIVVAVVFSVVAVVVLVWYFVSKKKKERQAELDQAYSNLNKAIIKYVGAIHEGTVSRKIIKSVVDSANKLIVMKNSKKYKVNFDDEQIMFVYNTDISNSWEKDVKITEYLNGSVQGDWNPAVRRNANVSMVVLVDEEQETIEAMRRLAEYPGICHIRTKDGSSFAADIQVKEDRKYSEGHKLAAYTLEVSRVESEEYDGITYAEWKG